MSGEKRRVCVIGAGLAGLCAVRHCVEQGLDVVAYEKATKIGGVWLFSEQITQAPPNSNETQGILYENLRSNLPKEVMGYPDYPFPDMCEESFVTSQQFLKYFELYAEHYKLHEHIQFQHEVLHVTPQNDRWKVVVHDLTMDQLTVEYFDFVFVCYGNYEKRDMPEIAGMDIFQGQQVHSQFYRRADDFKDAKVLLIGCGPSGLEIAQQLQLKAAQVYLSHHASHIPNISALQNLTLKPDVERFTETGAIFKDGSTAEITHVIYCTGYEYAFPCIGVDAGVYVTDHWVKPLWKHCIVISNPTMAIIDLPRVSIPAMTSDLQVRFALKFFTGAKKLPSKELMLEDMENEMKKRLQKGWSKKSAHNMADLQFEYFDDLVATADIATIEPVYVKMMGEIVKSYFGDYIDYRNHCYRIIDNENFIKFPFEANK